MDTLSRIIGVDESGKGDFFGPLVVAAFLADKAEVPRLSEMGVRDSKLIADRKLLQIDKTLRRQFPHAVVVVHPEEYNRHYMKIRNLNRLLAWGHARAIEDVSGKYPADLVISDKFGKTELVEQALLERGQDICLKQLVRGESIPQVGAASILARAAFIREMEKLSHKFGIELPRGAAAKVDEAGRKIVSLHGVEVLTKVAKTHFKNFHRVVDPRLFT